MFDIENWAEIFSTIRKNKLRTFLTGFSISWGIFMFCILLAAGNGLRNGMLSNFENRSKNSLTFWGRSTSKPYKGFPDNRPIKLDEKDLNLIKTQVPEADEMSPQISTGLSVSYETRNTDCDFTGVSPAYMDINGIKILDGRFINDLDMQEQRKVAVVNEQMKQVLFNDENPVGKLFIAGKLSYTVIGVFHEESWGNEKQAYIPFSTAQLLYNKGWGINSITFTLKDLDTEEANKAFETDFREKLSILHYFDVKDERPIGIWNSLQNYLQFVGIFNGISAFIWIIGIGTLIAGIIGISNIMLITVRERTKEIGIRKALGAKPRSILSSILMESVFITSLFGYVGMFLGVGLGELVASALQSPGLEEASYVFQNPTIPVGIAIGAMIILILSGLVAGYFPAWKAVRIPPIEAMRAE